MATEQMYFNSENLDLIIRASHKTGAKDWKEFVVNSAVDSARKILKEEIK